ncbi:MAG TPA: HAMP domain-containing sensor histidine kinase [Pseudomonadales bacterium]
MTPEAVIDRYLETASREPLDPTELALLVGTDADLLCRWLQVLQCPAEPAAFIDAVAAMPPERFRDLALSQALAVLTVSGSVRLSFDQWQSVLNTSLAAELLAIELGLPDPVALRWRVLLAASGVSLPQDPVLCELLAFRGARPELLEDASLMHRLFAVVEALDVSEPLDSQQTAHALLGIEPERYQLLLATAERQAAELLERLGLQDGDEVDYGERLWLRLQISMLGRLFPADAAHAPDALLEAHTLVARRLFGCIPELFLTNEAQQRLVRLGGGGPDIGLGSQSSTIARSARGGERLELYDRTDQSVADRQVLRRLGVTRGVCMPLVDSIAGTVTGVLVFPVDEDVDHETAMALYAQELVKRLAASGTRASADSEGMARFRQLEEKRLRELVHEAYNPLSIVNNYLHILELKLGHEPQVVDQLRLISAELRRASDIIAQIREVPREAERPEAQAELDEVDLSELAAHVVELHAGYARDHGVDVSAALPDDRLVVRSDGQRLMQILNNLVRNAIEAANGASVTVAATGGIYREGREGAVLEVRDTGPGLPPDVLDRLAEPKQTTKGGSHSGLGLHIVHRLVAELGGSIDVRTSSSGTTFTIFVPLTPVRAV